MPEANSEKLVIWIPIIHDQADLGSMSTTVKDFLVKKIGKEKWDKRRLEVSRFWERTRNKILEMASDFSNFRLFQDGLPICGKEPQIVNDLAKSGSTNNKLLLELMEKGARLTGTESASLLIEEYQLTRLAFSNLGEENPDFVRNREETAKRLLEKRDEFIARRIEETLLPGETGLVFLGALHSLKGKLPESIRVIKLNEIIGQKPIGAQA